VYVEYVNATRQVCTWTPGVEQCGAAAAHVCTGGGTVRRGGRACGEGRWNSAARWARTWTPRVEQCGAAAAHVCTGGGTVQRGSGARVHRRQQPDPSGLFYAA